MSRSFFEGKHIEGVIPQHIYEHMLARHYGWSLESIRLMSYYDFQVHIRICMMRDASERDFQLALAGAKPKGAGGSKMPSRPGSKTIHKKFDPMVGDFV